MVMRRLQNLDDWKLLRQRLDRDASRDDVTLVIPAGTCGRASGAEKVIAAVEAYLLQHDAGVRLRVTGCHGFCEMEPSVLVEPQGWFYPRLEPASVPRVIEAALAGRADEALVFKDPETKTPLPRQSEVPFFKYQTRQILGRNEKTDPLRIHSYLRQGGYGAVVKCLEGMSPGQVVEEVTESGLRGRGGGGFPTGRKWAMLAATEGAPKTVVCNGDEGDPGAYMDRSLLEGCPHSILEGMLIGAYATGASRGVIYVRAEYPLAIAHMTQAIQHARSLGLLGERILGTSFSFDVDLVRGAGAFVCGEETALIRSIEGKRGEPRQRPPFPARSGIEGRPTVINNVETWANIPVVIEGGAAEYRNVGSEGNTGTKIFSLVGKVPNTGLVEVPMGTPIGDIVYKIGGAARDAGDLEVKAVQTGGPSGGCIPASRFDLPVDYDSLRAFGAIMGSGGMIVMDRSTCMVDVAKYFMNFLKDESCGKCLPCRKGVQRMHEILDDITHGRGAAEQLDLLEELAVVVRDTSMCGLGQTAPNPVLSTLREFRHEYEEHVSKHHCVAGVCTSLVRYRISDACIGCGRCKEVCPAGAVSGPRRKLHRIDDRVCTRCGACAAVCPAGAVETA